MSKITTQRRNPARSLNLIIPVTTISQKFDTSTQWVDVFLPDNMFLFSVHTKHKIQSPIRIYVISAAILKDHRLGRWTVHRGNEDVGAVKCGILHHSETHYELDCSLQLTSWVQFFNWKQIGWRFCIRYLQNPAFTLNLEFISKNELLDTMQHDGIQNMLSEWLTINDNWFNIDRPHFNLHNAQIGGLSKDGMIIDRANVFRTDNIMKFVSNMVTKKKNVFDIFNDNHFPFHHELMRFKDETGIDHGSLTQEYFQSIFRTIAKRLIREFTVKDGHALIRMWIMCLKMKSYLKFAEQYRSMPFDLECRMPSSYFNTIYFQIVFGKLDRLIFLQNIDDIVTYLQVLSAESIVSIWVPRFVKRYSQSQHMEEEQVMFSIVSQLVFCLIC